MPDPEGSPDSEKEKPEPVPLPSIGRDPRVDPQPGNELLGRGQLRRIVRREGENI
jgi:hypothetical protein